MIGNKFAAPDIKLDFSDVLIRPRRSTLASRRDVTLERSFTFHKPGAELKDVIPIIASNMDTVVDFNFAQKLAEFNLLSAIPKHFGPEEWQAFADSITDQGERTSVFNKLAICTGTGRDDLLKTEAICAAHPDLRLVCVDVANGYSTHFQDAVRHLREALPRHIIIAGNVVTAEMVEELLLMGADIIKIGIGPGSVCQTRLKAGVGYPQFSAVLECAQAAHALNGHIISDGGCTSPGDVAKAFGAGADFVMLGGMFAGHDECPGEIEVVNGRRYKLFYGMASKRAQEKHHGGLAEYRSSEGKCVAVPLRGPVSKTVQDILGGLRSACTYVGASQLVEFEHKAQFIRVHHQLNQSLSQFDVPDTSSNHSASSLAAAHNKN